MIFMQNRKRALCLLIIIIILYIIYYFYMHKYYSHFGYREYESLSIEIMYIYKLIYLILNYSLFNLIIYIYNPYEYKLNERLINITIFSYFLLSEIGLISNALKRLIY